MKFPEEQKAIEDYGRDLKTAMVTFFPMMVWRTLPFEWLRQLFYPLLAGPQMKLSMNAGERMAKFTRSHAMWPQGLFEACFGHRGDVSLHLRTRNERLKAALALAFDIKGIMLNHISSYIILWKCEHLS